MLYSGPNAEERYAQLLETTGGVSPADADFSELPPETQRKLVAEEAADLYAEVTAYGLNPETQRALVEMIATEDPRRETTYTRLRHVQGVGRVDPNTGKRPRVPSVSAHPWSPDQPMPSPEEDGPGSRTATVLEVEERAYRRAAHRWDHGDSVVAVFDAFDLFGNRKVYRAGEAPVVR